MEKLETELVLRLMISQWEYLTSIADRVEQANVEDSPKKLTHFATHRHLRSSIQSLKLAIQNLAMAMYEEQFIGSIEFNRLVESVE